MVVSIYNYTTFNEIDEKFFKNNHFSPNFYKCYSISEIYEKNGYEWKIMNEFHRKRCC